MRRQMDYFAHGPQTSAVIEKLAAFEPRPLGCMHGSCFAGDGRQALLAARSRANEPAQRRLRRPGAGLLAAVARAYSAAALGSLGKSLR